MVSKISYKLYGICLLINPSATLSHQTTRSQGTTVRGAKITVASQSYIGDCFSLSLDCGRGSIPQEAHPLRLTTGFPHHRPRRTQALDEKRKRYSQKLLEQPQQTTSIRNNKVVRRNLEMKNRALTNRAVFASSHSPSVPMGSGISPKCDNAKQGYLHMLAGVQRATARKRVSELARDVWAGRCSLSKPVPGVLLYTNWLRWLVGRLESVIVQHPWSMPTATRAGIGALATALQ
jgi:hypothetical protein